MPHRPYGRPNKSKFGPFAWFVVLCLLAFAAYTVYVGFTWTPPGQ